jgi:hypothetical protein
VEPPGWAKWHFIEQAFLNETLAVMDIYAQRLEAVGYRFGQPKLRQWHADDASRYSSEVSFAIHRESDDDIADWQEFFVIRHDKPCCTVVELRDRLVTEIEAFLRDPGSRFTSADRAD